MSTYALLVAVLVLLTLVIIVTYVCVATEQWGGSLLWLTGVLTALITAIYGIIVANIMADEAEATWMYAILFGFIAVFNLLVGFITSFDKQVLNQVMSGICAFLMLMASGGMIVRLYEMNKAGAFDDLEEPVE